MRDAPTPEFLALQQALAGRYSLVRELGRGGMGVVYLARDVRLDRPVALKQLPPAYAAQPVLRERFLREARTAARLSHPHIVPIHAVEEVGDFVFFVMAYVEGETLGRRVRERGPLAAKDATRILREVAWALAYAHTQGVVHRDVKPDNILLEEGSGRALVMDFGIAQVGSGAALTAVSEVLGTAEFMSPEQASGETTDARSDLYSLAVVGHFLISGRLPLQGATVAATLAKHLTQPAPLLASVAPDAPRPLAEAIDRCLAKDPAERFQSGEELAAALGWALELRREAPAALRLFADRNQELASGVRGVILVQAWTQLFWVTFVLAGLAEPPEGVVLAVSYVFLASLGVTVIGMFAQNARRLLKAGYDQEDVVRSLRADLEERRQAVTSETQRDHDRVARLVDRLRLTALAVYAGGLALAFGPYFSGIEAIIAAVSGTAILTSIGAEVLAAARGLHRGALPAEGWLRFWKSRIGNRLFKAAGVGLDAVPDGAAFYRPTEMAIGLAADRLFEALPRDVRSSLHELPDVLRTLERDAEKTRARVEELDRLFHQVDDEEARVPGVETKRDALAEELRTTKEAAEERLAEIVAALETVRLGLLRLHAGAGSVESVTADLGAARELAEDIARALEGAREVDELLGFDRSVGRLETPTPV